jgi:ABC-type bacteriocin/lantibiotic exporter with double-glycine peptidase domain
VLNAISKSISFMKPHEKLKFYFLLVGRSVVSLIDLAAILGIGVLSTSVALQLAGTGNSGTNFKLGPFQAPYISADSLPFLASLILALFITKAITSILLTRQMAYFLARVEARAARKIAESAFGDGLDRSRENSREEIQFAVQIGSPGAFNLLLNSVGTLAAEGFLFVLVLAAFITVNPGLALAALLYFGLVGFLIQFFIGRLMYKSGEKLTESTIEANSGLSNLGDVLRESIILGKQDFFFDKILHSRQKAASSSAMIHVLSGMPRYIVETALIIAIASFIMIQALGNDLASSAATLGIFLSGGLRLTASLLPLQTALLTIKQSLPPAQKALDILFLKKESTYSVKEMGDEAYVGPVEVKLERVNFQYKGSQSQTLLDVSLEIKPGSQVALIGSSGAGKSTLADLMLGLLLPTDGAVLINEEPAHKAVRTRPGQMGYVPQKPGLIFGSITQNIALGVSPLEIDEQKLQNAIKKANLKGLIDSLPEGLNTDLGKGKDELSGGQLQRIGLARALYTQPKFLVMDEATSSLDAESEQEINEALDAMRGEVTVVLIAHRLNTIQRSDVVYLVDEGSIADFGTFPQLLKTNPKVRNLAKLMAIDSEESQS